MVYLRLDAFSPVQPDQPVGVKEAVEAPGRVELPTNGLGNRCSIHLSYGATTVWPHYLTLVYRSRFRVPLTIPKDGCGNFLCQLDG